MNIAVIYGGRSGEHEISLISASSIVRGINKKNNVYLIGITKDGKWFLQNENEYKRICSDDNSVLTISEEKDNLISIIPGGKTKAFSVKNESLTIDIVFPVLHGTYGEDGTIQGLLEMADIPYVGCPTLASAITRDKEKTKTALAQAGIPVVPGFCLRRADTADWQRYDEVLEEAQKTLGFPMFVKPCSAGSSD